MERFLRCFVVDLQRSWAHYLIWDEHSHNLHTSLSTGHSPFEHHVSNLQCLNQEPKVDTVSQTVGLPVLAALHPRPQCHLSVEHEVCNSTLSLALSGMIVPCLGLYQKPSPTHCLPLPGSTLYCNTVLLILGDCIILWLRNVPFFPTV